MRPARRSGRKGVALAASLALLLGGVGTTAAQTPPAPRSEVTPKGQQTMTRSVTGTVKQVVADGLVIEERKGDGSAGREWAFAVQADTRTRIAKGSQQIKADELRAGDRVAVTYSDRGGKVVAETITRLDGTQ